MNKSELPVTTSRIISSDDIKVINDFMAGLADVKDLPFSFKNIEDIPYIISDAFDSLLSVIDEKVGSINFSNFNGDFGNSISETYSGQSIAQNAIAMSHPINGSNIPSFDTTYFTSSIDELSDNIELLNKSLNDGSVNASFNSDRMIEFHKKIVDDLNSDDLLTLKVKDPQLDVLNKIYDLLNNKNMNIKYAFDLNTEMQKKNFEKMFSSSNNLLNKILDVNRGIFDVINSASGGVSAYDIVPTIDYNNEDDINEKQVNNDIALNQEKNDSSKKEKKDDKKSATPSKNDKKEKSKTSTSEISSESNIVNKTDLTEVNKSNVDMVNKSRLSNMKDPKTFYESLFGNKEKPKGSDLIKPEVKDLNKKTKESKTDKITSNLKEMISNRFESYKEKTKEKLVEKKNDLMQKAKDKALDFVKEKVDGKFGSGTFDKTSKVVNGVRDGYERIKGTQLPDKNIGKTVNQVKPSSVNAVNAKPALNTQYKASGVSDKLTVKPSPNPITAPKALSAPATVGTNTVIKGASSSLTSAGAKGASTAVAKGATSAATKVAGTAALKGAASVGAKAIPGIGQASMILDGASLLTGGMIPSTGDLIEKAMDGVGSAVKKSPIAKLSTPLTGSLFGGGKDKPLDEDGDNTNGGQVNLKTIETLLKDIRSLLGGG